VLNTPTGGGGEKAVWGSEFAFGRGCDEKKVAHVRSGTGTGERKLRAGLGKIQKCKRNKKSAEGEEMTS